MRNAALGSGWRRLPMARLATGDRIGIESRVFDQEGAETVEPSTTGPRPGVSCICVQAPYIEGLAQRIVDHGGKQSMPVMSFLPNDKLFQPVYCTDPFDNIIEIDTHGFESTWAPPIRSTRAGDSVDQADGHRPSTRSASRRYGQ